MIIKRNGKKEQLSKKKIFDSIKKANYSTGVILSDTEIEEITNQVVKTISEQEQKTLHIDIIEDLIEQQLMRIERGYLVAKSYIKYRYEKERVRNNHTLMEKLTAMNVANQNANVDEYSFGGRMGEMASYVAKDYALKNLIPAKHAENHNNNEIYIHDLDHYAVGDHNCLSIPFDDLLKNGFNTRQTDIRPANSISTAVQLIAVIFQLQSLQQFGGVAATHIDWTLVPYVRKSFYKHFVAGLKHIKNLSDDEISAYFKSLLETTTIDSISIDSDIYNKKDDSSNRAVYNYAYDQTIYELNQSVEALYHNLNTLQSRSGNQLPFTSLNYGSCTLTEGRLVIRALLQGSINGVGKFHRTNIFPCGIFQLADGINRKPGDPNYDLFKLAMKSTATRLYPNYANMNWTVDKTNLETDRNEKQKILDSLSAEDKSTLIDIVNKNSDIKEFLMINITDDNHLLVDRTIRPFEIMSTMGCRTYNGFDINSVESYSKNVKSIIKSGKPYDNVRSGCAKDGRGNICPVTIILPELAMKANQDKDTFMKLLAEKIDEAANMLLERFDWICSQPMKSAKFMYENNTMYGYVENEGIRSALKHGTLAIGQIGLAETLELLIGCDHTTEEGMKLAVEIEKLFNEKCAKLKKTHKLNFGVYLTPGENLCKTAMTKFKGAYGVLENVSDKDYFTNSIHVPVYKNKNPFEKIDIESNLAKYSNAGCITYVELDSNTTNNMDALETLINYAMDKDIPYFAVNVPSDMCMDCGHSGDIPYSCPACKSKNIQRLRRVTGYLTGDYLTAFNKGKIQEVNMRVKHNGKEV